MLSFFLLQSTFQKYCSTYFLQNFTSLPFIFLGRSCGQKSLGQHTLEKLQQEKVCQPLFCLRSHPCNLNRSTNRQKNASLSDFVCSFLSSYWQFTGFLRKSQKTKFLLLLTNKHTGELENSFRPPMETVRHSKIEFPSFSAIAFNNF